MLIHNLAHTIRLFPTKAQETFFKKACGCACEICGLAIDRDLNAAINLRNYGLNKIGVACPEITPVDKEALVYSSEIGINETILEDAGIFSVLK